MSAKIDVVQLGARMHYAVPALLAMENMLGKLFTDTWSPQWFYPVVKTLPFSFAKKLAGRNHSAIPDNSVKSNSSLGFAYTRALKKTRHDRELETGVFLEFSSRFQHWVLETGPLQAEAIYAFNTVAKDVFSHASSATKLKILEQTLVPRIIENRWLAKEYEFFNIPFPTGEFSKQYENLELEEVALANVIITGSDFVKNSLIELGISSQKIVVIPYGYTPSDSHPTKTTSSTRVKRCLFVGNGGIRKGIRYLIEAAAIFPQLEFSIAGVMEPALLNLPKPSNVTFLGSVERSEMPTLYASHDVFILPSLCEGSATVSYEALSYGLPVLCTPNSGSVITHEHDGLLFEPQSVEAIAKALETITSNASLFLHLKENSKKTAQNYTTASYGIRLLNQLRKSI